MTWESFYLICFVVGFLLSLVSLLFQSADLHLAGGDSGGDLSLGDGADAGHLDLGHADVHHGGSGHAHYATSHAVGVVSRFNFSTITAFLAWFGGSGYLLKRYTGLWTIAALVIAKLIGLIGAAMVFWFLAKLAQRDRTLNPADFDMVGVLGEVTCRIRSGGVGEMMFTQDGVRKSAPIRSDDDTEIEKGTEVVITRYERGVGFVRRWSDLAGSTSGF